MVEQGSGYASHSREKMFIFRFLVSFPQTICQNVKYPLDERAKKEYNKGKNKLKEGISLD